MRRERFVRAVLGALVLVVPVGCASDPAGLPSREADLRVLFVGNSLTAWNDLPLIVEAMADSAGVEPMVAGHVLSAGASLEDHWIGGYAPAAIRTGTWDVVVVQQGPSSLLESQQHLAQWARRYAELADSVGTRLALYMVWPDVTRGEAFDAVSESYRTAAAVSGSALYPAGEAWRSAWAADPGLNLYGPDGFHPSAMGSYLAALTIFQGIYGVATDEVPAVLRLRNGARVSVPVTAVGTLRAAAADATARFGVRAGVTAVR